MPSSGWSIWEACTTSPVGTPTVQVLPIAGNDGVNGPLYDIRVTTSLPAGLFSSLTDSYGLEFAVATCGNDLVEGALRFDSGRGCIAAAGAGAIHVVHDDRRGPDRRGAVRRAPARILTESTAVRLIMGLALRSDPMISLRNVEKFYEAGYGKNFVLRRIDADIKEGEFVTIMGPSGAGKSTLLSILGMLDSAWTGEFYFFDHAVHKMKPKERVELNKKYIGFVFQSYHLIDNLTVYENLDIPLSYRNIKSSERASMVCDTLDRFHIVGKRDLYPSQLSGGQQQLVAVARAVIANPKLILADEPTGNLHSSQGKEIMELFKRLNEEGATIVQVTHSEANAAYGHRIINLADGWIVKN